MNTTVVVNDRENNTLNGQTTSQTISAISRSIVNGKSVVALTIPTGTLSVQEDNLIVSHPGNRDMFGVVKTAAFFIVSQ